MNGLIGRKVGMTSIFDDAGKNVACTVLEVGPCVVTQVKSEDTDGYNALQLGFGEAKAKNTSQSILGHLEKAGTGPKRKLKEFNRIGLAKQAGDVITVEEIFTIGDKVNVIGVSKGKGFQGVVKRHGFSGVGGQTHGQHDRLRAPGSLGASSFPSKVAKGMRMAGQTGNATSKMKNLKVVKIYPEQNIMVVHGAVPGHKGSIVLITKK